MYTGRFLLKYMLRKAGKSYNINLFTVAIYLLFFDIILYLFSVSQLYTASIMYSSYRSGIKNKPNNSQTKT